MDCIGCRLASILIIFSVFFPSLLPGQEQKPVPCNKTYNKKVEKLYDAGMVFFKKGNYTEALRSMKSAKPPKNSDASAKDKNS